jgi:hypothetical protein
MKVGDLIKEREWPELGVIIEIKDRRLDRPYTILCPNGNIEWFTQTYINQCEVINESK